MMQFIMDKIKNIKLTLRFCVVFILTSFFVVALSILFPIVYSRLNKDYLQASFQFMRLISVQVIYKITDEMNNIEIAAKFSEELIKTNVVDPHNQQEFINYLYSLMKIET